MLTVAPSMEAQAAARSRFSVLFIELVVIVAAAAVIFSFFAVVDATTAPNDGVDLRVSFTLFRFSFVAFICCC